MSGLGTEGRLVVDRGIFQLGREEEILQEAKSAVSRLWHHPDAKPIIDRFG